MHIRRYLQSDDTRRERAKRGWVLFLGIALLGIATPPGAQIESSTPLLQDIVLVLDNSGSMKNNDPRFLTKDAVAQFVEDVPDEARLSVVIFDKHIRATPLGSRDGINLAQLNYRGPLTDIPAAVQRAIQELKDNGRAGAKSILLLTDGVVDTGDRARDQEVTRWLREQLASDADDSGIRIFTIALAAGSDIQLLQELAERTGGRYFHAQHATDLQGIFVQISDAFFAPTSTPSTSALAPESISESLGETPEPAVDTPVGSSEDAFDRTANKPDQAAVVPPAPGLSDPEAPAATAEPLTGEPSVAAPAEKTGPESQASAGGSEPGTARETLSMTEPAESNQNSSAATPSSAVPIEPGAPGIPIMYGLVVIAVFLMGGMLALVAVLVWNKSRVKPAGHETPAHPPLPAAFLLDLGGVTGRKRHQLGTVTVVGRNYLVIDQLERVPASERNHIVIDRPTIGRVHAVVEHKHRGFWLVDQNSKNGTYVNGNRVNGPVCLTHGDQIQFHDFAFEFALAGMNLADATVVAGGDLTLLRDSIARAARAVGEKMELDKRDRLSASSPGNQSANPESGPRERSKGDDQSRSDPDVGRQMGLDTVELAMAVEDIFEIEIPSESAEKLDTVGKLHEFVVAELVRLGRPRVNPDIVFDELRTVICYQLGVKPEEVIPSARFAQDLRAD